VPADRTAPRLARVRFRSGTISFRLRESAVVHVSVLRGGRIVRRLTLHATPGANSVSVGRLPVGRYRLVLLATDDAGNTARPVSKRVRVA